MASLNVPMPDELRAYIDERVERGDFSTPSEFVRALIRADRDRDSQRRLEQLLLEGLDSGPATEMTAEDWEDIRSTVRGRLAERREDGRKKRKRKAG